MVSNYCCEDTDLRFVEPMRIVHPADLEAHGSTRAQIWYKLLIVHKKIQPETLEPRENLGRRGRYNQIWTEAAAEPMTAYYARDQRLKWTRQCPDPGSMRNSLHRASRPRCSSAYSI